MLSSDAITGAAGRLWYRYHDRLASSSTDAVHVEAVGAPHAIHEGNEAIVATAVDAVAAAVQGDGRLTGCRRTLPPGRRPLPGRLDPGPDARRPGPHGTGPSSTLPRSSGAPYWTARTESACGPFCPCEISNSTRCPSSRER